MGSRSPEGDRRSRRRNDEDDVPSSGNERKKTLHYELKPDKSGCRRRFRDREDRRRSRTPDSKDRRSRSRDRMRRRDRDRDADGDGAKDNRRERSRDQDSGRRRPLSPDGQRSRRDRDRGRERDLTEKLETGGRDRRRQRSAEKQPSRREPRLLLEGGPEDARPDTSKRSLVKRGGPLPSQGDSFAISTGEEPEKPVEKPNFETTGTLAAVSNSVAQADGSTITLKYHEPPEARKPPPRDVWKLFVFKGSDIVDTIELSHRSCWLVGRESAVVDLPAEHPSISKQHAVIQFRYTEKRNEFGDKIGRVKPYLIDLESANGTSLNNEKVPESRYLELRTKDMIQFGLSTREYVLVLAPKD
ncbi:SMAD/FHA domain-containing protein [Podospora didyma]|uniref:SMAD/FHA domain-containing protein n=1 Tax=Podospora didyma TaxID=330526 RepID=A0AAE0TZE9_9PEZI|nr:SMAD/FHA domain-containing protein [Podospora didyma]